MDEKVIAKGLEVCLDSIMTTNKCLEAQIRINRRQTSFNKSVVFLALSCLGFGAITHIRLTALEKEVKELKTTKGE